MRATPARIALAFLAAVVVFLVLFFASNIFRQETADFRGETSKKEQVEANGQYRIGAYDSFYDLCASVQAVEDSIANQLLEYDAASTGRQQQISANVTASRNVRAAKIREYNQDARKSYTQGQFRASDLPFQLDITQEATSCGI